MHPLCFCAILLLDTLREHADAFGIYDRIIYLMKNSKRDYNGLPKLKQVSGLKMQMQEGLCKTH